MQTVLLSKRDQTDRASQEKWAEQRAAELAAAAAAPKDQRITALEQSLLQLEIALAQKTEVMLAHTALGTSAFNSQKFAPPPTHL